MIIIILKFSICRASRCVVRDTVVFWKRDCFNFEIKKTIKFVCQNIDSHCYRSLDKFGSLSNIMGLIPLLTSNWIQNSNRKEECCVNCMIAVDITWWKTTLQELLSQYTSWFMINQPHGNKIPWWAEHFKNCTNAHKWYWVLIICVC